MQATPLTSHLTAPFRLHLGLLIGFFHYGLCATLSAISQSAKELENGLGDQGIGVPFTVSSRPTLGPIQRVPDADFPGGKADGASSSSPACVPRTPPISSYSLSFQQENTQGAKQEL
jgi:hypothetical protein